MLRTTPKSSSNRIREISVSALSSPHSFSLILEQFLSTSVILMALCKILDAAYISTRVPVALPLSKRVASSALYSELYWNLADCLELCPERVAFSFNFASRWCWCAKNNKMIKIHSQKLLQNLQLYLASSFTGSRSSSEISSSEMLSSELLSSAIVKKK